MAATEPILEVTAQSSLRILTVLLEILKEQLGETISPERFGADLTELGVDSLMALDISHRLEDELGIVIDDRDALGFRTVNAICETLQRATAPVANAK
jgi:acyl carrier protein